MKILLTTMDKMLLLTKDLQPLSLIQEIDVINKKAIDINGMEYEFEYLGINSNLTLTEVELHV